MHAAMKIKATSTYSWILFIFKHHIPCCHLLNQTGQRFKAVKNINEVVSLKPAFTKSYY